MKPAIARVGEATLKQLESKRTLREGVRLRADIERRSGLQTPKIGVIYNPKSAANLGRSPLRAIGVACGQPTTRGELVSVLRGFADAEVNIVAVSGGDGTIREVLTAIPQAYGDLPHPAIAILAAGRTDLIAGEVGSSGRRDELARISRNGRQDQGVAVDILCPAFRSVDAYLSALPGAPPQRLLALDGITNPQNRGMIVRSATAGRIDGILWARKGNAALGPLVVKASAGTLYRAPLLVCASLPQALQQCAARGVEICTLAAQARHTLFEHRAAGHCIYVLGNESEGVSEAVSQLADTALSIPMSNRVESLNVAVTAGLIAYAPALARSYRER